MKKHLILIAVITFCLSAQSQSLTTFSEVKDGISYLGLKNKNGDIVVKPTNSKIDCYPSADTYLLENKDGKFSIVNNKGKKLYGGFVRYIGKFSDGILGVFYGDLHKKQAFVTSAGKQYYEFNGNDKYTDNSIEIIPGTKIGIGAGAGGGLLDTLGQQIASFKWEWGCKKDKILAFYSNSLYSINFDGSRKLLGDFTSYDKRYDAFYKNGFLKVSNNDSVGVVLESGKIIVPCKYAAMDLTDSRLIVVTTFDKKLGIYSIEGKEILPTTYRSIQYNYDGHYYYCINDDEKKAIFTTKMIIPPIYESLIRLGDIGFVYTKDSKKGLISSNGTTNILNSEYDDISILSGKLLNVVKNKKHGIFNSENAIATNIHFNDIFLLSKTFFAASVDSLYGIIDAKGNWLAQPKYRKISLLGNKEILTLSNDKYGIIDTLGNWVCQPRFHSIIFQDRDLWAQDSIKGKYGAILKDGNWISNFKFDEIPTFNKIGQARVKFDGKYGVIDTNYKYILPPIYCNVLILNKSYLVCFEKGWCHIPDQNHFLVIYPDFEEVRQKGEEYAIKKNGKWGLMSIDGEIVFESEFDSPFYFEGKTTTNASLNGKQVMVAKEGLKGLKDNESYVLFWTDNSSVNPNSMIEISMYHSPGLGYCATYRIASNSEKTPDCTSETSQREKLNFGDYKYTVKFNGSTSEMQNLKIDKDSRCNILKIE